MFQVVRAEQQRHRTGFHRIQQGLPRFGFAGQFRAVAFLKFFPFGRIVIEPLPEFMAGGHVLEPGDHGQRFFFYAARPKSFHQKSLAVGLDGRFIDTSEFNNGRF